jgi:broad specificity phosphatase PhoE
MRALYVIRHAEPAITGVLAGQSDPPLSSVGRKQAAAIRIPACTVYTSPLRRAFETATYLTPLPIVIPGFAEISYGAWDGLSWLAIERQWPDLAALKLKEWQHIVPPEGEPWTEFYNRVSGSLSLILEGPLPAAIVAHEAVNAVIAHLLTHSEIDAYQQQYCQIAQYEL